MAPILRRHRHWPGPTQVSDLAPLVPPRSSLLGPGLFAWCSFLYVAAGVPDRHRCVGVEVPAQTAACEIEGDAALQGLGNHALDDEAAKAGCLWWTDRGAAALHPRHVKAPSVS